MNFLARTLLPVALLASTGAAHAGLPPQPEVAAFAGRVLADECDPQGPGMAVLLMRGDEVLYRGACGMANLELGVPVSPDHVFRIGSVTKQFTAAAVLKLAEDGRLALSDPLSKFVPGYPGGEAVTLEMLLNHTSGIRSYTEIEAVMAGGGIMRDVTTQELIDSFRDEKPDFAPGEGWHYNNSGYVLLGAVIEAATGKPWHVHLDEVFFRPLGMTRTGYGNADEAVIPGHVDGYTRNGERWARAPYLSMTQPHAAGALVSTVDDLLKWNRALHEGRVLREASYRAMVTPVGKAVDNRYGYGIFTGTLRGEPQLQHGGGINGFNSYLLHVPGSRTGVAVLQNTDSPHGMPGAEGIARVLAAMAIGRPYPEKTPIEVAPETLAQYEGVYRIDAGTTRIIRVIDGRLTSQRTGGRVFPLVPVAEDTFLFEEGHSRIVFERDAAGAVRAMRFFPEDEGGGEVVPRSDEALPAGRREVSLPREALERVTGEYAFEGAVLRVFLDGGILKVQLAGQPALEIHAQSPSEFFLEVVDATLEFTPAGGRPTGVILRQAGREMPFRRVH